jgi:hypothetical protein
MDSHLQAIKSNPAEIMMMRTMAMAFWNTDNRFLQLLQLHHKCLSLRLKYWTWCTKPEHMTQWRDSTKHTFILYSSPSRCYLPSNAWISRGTPARATYNSMIHHYTRMCDFQQQSQQIPTTFNFWDKTNNNKKLRGLSPWPNCTDRANAACRQS